MVNLNINTQLRYSELDILRGISVIMMIIFHFFYLYYILGKDNETIHNPFVSVLATISHSLFIFIFGINIYINYNKNKNKDRFEYYKKQLYKFLIYGFIGICITLLTYYMFPEKYVKFGIFHFFAVSLVLANMFVTNKNHIMIGLSIFIGLYLFVYNNNSYYNKCLDMPFFCFVTGIKNVKYQSIDHFALIPFFTIVLCGMLLGSNLYDNNTRQFDLGTIQKYLDSNIAKLLEYIGQNSLYIYIAHWLVLYKIIKLIG